MPPVRVLVVDDVDIFRLMVRRILDRIDGLEVVAEAADGAEAIAMAQRHHPDVVLLDLNMPGMNGDEAIPGLRKAAPDARLVVLSGLEKGEVQRRLRDRPVEGIIEKGLPSTEFREALGRLAGSSAGSTHA